MTTLIEADTLQRFTAAVAEARAAGKRVTVTGPEGPPFVAEAEEPEA